MGWKASTIIIHEPTLVDNEQLLKELGFTNLVPIKEETFEVAMNPDDNRVYIGTYRDNLLICAPDIPLQFFGDTETAIEKIFNRLFPGSEICSIVLHSVVNLWGYSVTVDAHKVRARAGSSDDGTSIEIGEPLEEEKELLSKSTVDENGIRTYLFDDFPDEPFNEDQVGENFVFAICKRYFGEELDNADELLFDTTLTGYKYGKVIQNEINKQGEKLNTDNSKPWWKFW